MNTELITNQCDAGACHKPNELIKWFTREFLLSNESGLCNTLYRDISSSSEVKGYNFHPSCFKRWNLSWIK